MADDPGKTPAPRPRRRRTDIDPTYQPPKVAHERRRSKAAPPDAEDASSIPVDTAISPVQAAATDAVVVQDGAATGSPADDATTEQTRLFSAPATRAVDAAAAGTAAAASGPTEASEPWLSTLDDRSSDPAICPFLRGADGDAVGPPLERPDPLNRGAALRETVPQSLRQQELVCLTSGHVNCPRYLRGAAVVSEVPTPVVTSRRTLTPAVFGAIVLLIGAFALSVGFVASRGGLEVAAIATASPTASASSVAAASAGAVASPSGVPATIAPTPTAAPSPAPTATPSPSVAPTATPSPTPVSTVSPKPSSDRYALLTACPGTAKCWIYRVRSGDNIYSIARYFGVPIARVYAMNPWVKSSGLRAGQSLRLPPPTR